MYSIVFSIYMISYVWTRNTHCICDCKTEQPDQETGSQPWQDYHAATLIEPELDTRDGRIINDCVCYCRHRVCHLHGLHTKSIIDKQDQIDSGRENCQFCTVYPWQYKRCQPNPRRRKVVVMGRPRYTAGRWGLIFQVNTWVMTDGSEERNFLPDSPWQAPTAHYHTL